MSSKPTIVFVPGAWHTPSCFELVATRLKAAGYGYIGVSTPSVRKEPPFPKDGGEDTEAVRAALNTAIGDGNDVLVVMHSYGGFPGSAACKGMSKEDRAKEGKKGGVVRLVYIASFAVPEGTNLSGGTGTAKGERGLADWCIVEVR
jgi:pimeloyl-ACP methyl ester carboxylesterase